MPQRRVEDWYMDIAQEITQLFRRDLTRLLQELEAFPDDGTVWRTLPGVGNSAGNLALHLEGNLREFVGRQRAIPAASRRGVRGAKIHEVSHH
jgi:hypothetical protein